jgi:hypothetical protein
MKKSILWIFAIVFVIHGVTWAQGTDANSEEQFKNSNYTEKSVVQELLYKHEEVHTTAGADSLHNIDSKGK